MYPVHSLTQYPQWPSSGAPLRYPIPPWNAHHYHPYHNSVTMGKKKFATQQQPQPSNGYVPPHPRHTQGVDSRQGLSQAYQPELQQSGVPQQPQYNATNAGQTDPYFSMPQRNGPQPQLPQQQPQQRYPPHQPRGLNAQVDNSRPGSRYTPPQTRSQRRALTTVSADQPVPSIETAQPTTNLQPWRLPVRNAPGKSPWNRRSMSTTPGISDQPVTPPVAPIPTESYLRRSLEAPERLTGPKKLLVLLDLNGTLLYRPRLKEGAPTRGRREHILRPGARKLIDYLFDNHAVMVYTSAMKHNAELCVDALLSHLSPDQRSKLIDIRPREQLGLTHVQLNAKVQVYKPLGPVWVSRKVLANGKENGCKWDERNTVLLDDSSVKAIGNPHSLLQVPEFTLADGTKEHDIDPAMKETEEAIMARVQQKLEELMWEVSVTRRIRVWQEKKETLMDPSEKKEQEVEAERVSEPKTTAVLDILATALAKGEAEAAAYPTPESTNVEESSEQSDDEGGVRLKSPSPVLEKDFDFVDGSKKQDVKAAGEGRYVDLSRQSA